MDSLQQLDHKMQIQVIRIYKKNKADFELLPAFCEAMERLIIAHQDIDDTVAKQISDTTGTTKSKVGKKEELASATFIMAGNIYSWAKNTNNEVVMGQTDVTISQLTKMNDQLLAPACRNILDLALANQEALVKYGVTADGIQQLLQLINDFVTLSAQPTTNRKDRSAYTKKIKDLFRVIYELFRDSLDKLIMNFKETKPDIFNSYQAARIIQSAGGGHKDVPPTPPAV